MLMLIEHTYHTPWRRLWLLVVFPVHLFQQQSPFNHSNNPLSSKVVNFRQVRRTRDMAIIITLRLHRRAKPQARQRLPLPSHRLLEKGSSSNLTAS